MKKIERIVALLLALVTAFSLLPGAAVATDSDSEKNTSPPKLEISASVEQRNSVAPTEVKGNQSHILIDRESESGSTGMTASTDSSIRRYTVLLLDVESSFSLSVNDVTIYRVSTPLETIKRAADKFIEQIQFAEGTNYVAIVSYSDKASIESSFTTDTNALLESVNCLGIGEFGSNINSALLAADTLLSEITDENAIKNVVLFTQGVNSAGDNSSSGPYTVEDCTWLRSDTNVYIYEYSNTTYNTVHTLMEKYNIYSIGLFQNFESVPEGGKSLLDFARRFAKDMQNSGYQEVDDVDDLEFAFGEVADSITAQRGYYKYAGFINNEADTVSEYVYSDSYFYEDATDYNESLATMSLCLELSSWSSYDQESWADKSINAEHLLTGCDRDICINDPGLGFHEFARNEFWDDTPTWDSIGAVAANKQIFDDGKEYTLIALAVRGGGYGSEWASNLTLGNEGNHAGFEEARDNVLSFLTSYINTYIDGTEAERTNLKLWIVGYSRGGAVANMVAGEINNNGLALNHINPIDPSDLYCYTFEAPQGVFNNTEDHPNIHNYLSVIDLVPYVAPVSWGFSRYGNTIKTPSKKTYEGNFNVALFDMETELEEMGFDYSAIYSIPEYVSSYRMKVDWLRILPGGEPLISWEPTNEKPTGTVVRLSVDFLSEEAIPGRTYYYDYMENSMREILGVLMHYDVVLKDTMTKVFEIFQKDNLSNIFKPAFSLNPFYTIDERQEDIQANIETYIFDALSDCTGVNSETIKSIIPPIVDILANALSVVADDLCNGDLTSFDLLAQFGSYIKECGFQPHYPEIVLAWVRSVDPNYNSSLVLSSNSTITRVLRVNCPVDICVYDESGTLVASIIDNLPSDNNALVAYVNENDEKIFYLPGGAEYTVEIAATNDGTVSVSVGELDYAYNGTTRMVNYYDIPVTTGTVLNGLIPAISDDELENNDEDGSSIEYRLLDSESNEIPADESVFGIESASAKYSVSVLIEGNSGKVSGGGFYEKGSYAKLEAQALSSGKFEGWYIDDQLISIDMKYRFAVTEDTEIVAKFSEIEFFELNNNETTGGKILSVEGVYPAGQEVSLVAAPNEGYVFDHWSANNGSFENDRSAETTFVMPASDVVVTAHWVREPDARNPFVDVHSDSFFYEPVLWAVANDITKGIDATHFGPLVDCNRAQVVTFLWRAAGSPEPTSTNNPFVDVRESEFYYKAVLWAVENNITNGMSATHFGPLDTCNRAQVVTFLWRVAGCPLPHFVDNPFEDMDSLSFYYMAVLWAIENDITNGMDSTHFGPGAICNRAQIVTFLYRAYN